MVVDELMIFLKIKNIIMIGIKYNDELLGHMLQISFLLDQGPS